MAFYPKKRSFGAAFGGRRPRRGYGKRPRYARKAPMYRMPSTIVKAHGLDNKTSVQGASLVCTVRLSELFQAPAFVRARLLHERVTIQSISVQFSVKAHPTAADPSFALSYFSRDDESDVTDVAHYLKAPSVVKHDLTKGTNSRTMTAKDLGTIATSPMITNQMQYVQHGSLRTPVTNDMGSLNGQSASIKIILPLTQMSQDATAAAGVTNSLYVITCYTTYVCKFMGMQDRLTATEATTLTQSFS